ncbi:murein hydrolase activator EnvC [Deinococcus sp.]|uniref:murein hydrolase activator EnvC family protein n=1 Tax=Deinococcus sp. TaxID=47478 RepID=UPI0025BE1DC3|nr:M23 family metallopeptidase [Deinococcus sp.]
MSRPVGHRQRAAALGITLLLLTGFSGLAQTTSERLERLQHDLRQKKNLNDQQAKQLETLRATLQNLSGQQKAALARLDALADSVAALENDLANVTARVSLAEQTLADLSSRRSVTEAQVGTLQANVRGILSALYRQRSGQYLALMTQSRSLSDLLIRLDYANLAGQHNVQIINALKQASANLQVQQAQQAEQARTLKDLQAERAGKLTKLRQSRAEQQTLLAELRRSAAGQHAVAVRTQAQQALTVQSIDQLVGKVVQERSRIEAQRKKRLEEERQRRVAEARRIAAEQERARLEAIRLAKLRAEQERQAREAQLARERAAAAAAAEVQRQRQLALERERQALRERQAKIRAEQARAQVVTRAQAQPLPPVGHAEAVGFPLSGGQIAAPYGTNGAQWVLISGPAGSQATAALTGNVLAATYYASLGWVVLLDHGSGIVTGYFGLQNASVTAGDRVQRGAAVGIIGGSPIFGAGRMAFQLRQNGQAVSPVFK